MIHPLDSYLLERWLSGCKFRDVPNEMLVSSLIPAISNEIFDLVGYNT